MVLWHFLLKKESLFLKIIDGHLHIFSEEAYGSVKAEGVGHENNPQHLRKVYEDLDIVGGVVMSNRSLKVEDHQYPKDLFHYCIGLDTYVMKNGLNQRKYDLIEENLKEKSCCGVKLYPGYTKIWLTDPMYKPVYELAQHYHKPVAIHTGLTAHPRAHLKYSHPLVVDEIASDFRKTRFVMCHLGNPFVQDATVVMAKNPNVYGDLSGFLEGRVNVDEYLQMYAGILTQMTQWVHYVGCWDRLMFGTDFPIVNYKEYVYFIRRLVPKAQQENVFFNTANYVYQLGYKSS